MAKQSNTSEETKIKIIYSKIGEHKTSKANKGTLYTEVTTKPPKRPKPRKSSNKEVLK